VYLNHTIVSCHDQQRSAAINRRDGGRGLYFEDPYGHLLEIITRPYGSAS